MGSFLLSDAMDRVHENSVSAIESLQTRFNQQRDVFFAISNLFDPRYAFLFFSPLMFSLDWRTGKKLMWVSIIAEWSNQILKWMLHGERPYWWVHETPIYNRTGIQFPAIKQYSLTCETGPGSPSGHAMVSAAVWYVLITFFLEKCGALQKGNKKNMMASTCWSIYAILLCVVSMSRVYLAAHFPHQCLLGIIIGYGVATAMNKLNVDNMTMGHYTLATVGLLASAMSTYGVLYAMGVNPSWSVDRAVKWCAKQEYIHMDTTPFFSMMRYCGFMLGLGLGLNSRFHQVASEVRFTPTMKTIAAIVAVGATKLSERVDLPKNNATVFYVFAFTMNVFLPYMMTALVPYIIAKVCVPKRKTQ